MITEAANAVVQSQVEESLSHQTLQEAKNRCSPRRGEREHSPASLILDPGF